MRERYSNRFFTGLLLMAVVVAYIAFTLGYSMAKAEDLSEIRKLNCREN